MMNIRKKHPNCFRERHAQKQTLTIYAQWWLNPRIDPINETSLEGSKLKYDGFITVRQFRY